MRILVIEDEKKVAGPGIDRKSKIVIVF